MICKKQRYIRNSSTLRLTLKYHLYNLTNCSSNSPVGTLYGIGIGPGDPELITLKALKRLQAAAVVAFPAGINGRPGVAEQIVQPWLSPQQTKLPLSFPYVLEPETLETAWQQAADTVWSHLQNSDVVFACEGDISFYGTFTYLAQALKQQHPTVKIDATAGVSSPMAAAAALGIPLACQAERLAILPALYNPRELEDALKWADVIVLMKVSRTYKQVWHILAQHNLLEQSYVVERATGPNQKRYLGLQNHPNLSLPYFSLLIVHRHQQRITMPSGATEPQTEEAN